MAKTTKKNLKIPQGSTYELEITFLDCDTDLPVNLSGYQARSHFRTSPSATSTLYEATELTDISFDAANGIVTLTIPAATTAAWTFTKAVYDLEVEAPDGTVTRLVKGRVTVDPENTK